MTGGSAWASLFSTASDPRRVITDPGLLRRYQRRRLVIALVGGFIGGIGIGFSFSHSGLIGAGIETALLVPLVVGVLLAVLFVLVALPPVVRWLVAVGAIVATMLAMDISFGWQIGLALVGAAVSWVVAAVLQFGIGVAQITVKDFVKAIGVGLGLLAVAAMPAGPATAQSLPGGRACDPEALVIQVGDDDLAFAAAGRGRAIEIEVDGDAVTRIPVSARSNIERGTVVIELVGLDPIDVLGVAKAVVWTGDLSPGPGGGRADGEVVIFRPEGASTLSVASEAHGADIGLVAGRGRYRATLHDPVTSTTCWLDGVVRITASPTATLPGRVGLAGAATGLGMVAASVLGGGVQATTRLRLREQTRQAVGGLPGYRLVLQLRLEEDEDAVHQVEATGLRWIDMVDLDFGGVVSFGDHLDIPIQVRTDPKKVRWAVASFDLEVSSGGLGHTVASVELSRFTRRWSVETLGSSETALDLRDPLPPGPPPTFPPPGAEPVLEEAPGSEGS